MLKAKSAREAIRLLTQAYEALDVEGVLNYLTEDVFWIGTGWHEHRFGKEAVHSLLVDDFMNDRTPYVVKFMDVRETVLRPGVSSVFALMNFSKKGNIELSVDSRSSYVCVDTEDGYKISSWHCSVGTSLQQDDEYFPVTFANDIMQKATMDALTGLRNRSSFQELAARQLEAQTAPLAFVLIDLDNFKHVNDHFGHHCGDEVLKFVAKQLGESFGENDSLGRLGGDEFVVMMPAVEHEEQVSQKVDAFIKNLSQTISLNGHPYMPSASVGVFWCEAGMGCDYERCYQAADAAMYRAKNSGKSTWVMEK